jgi:hypothetical protein
MARKNSSDFHKINNGSSTNYHKIESEIIDTGFICQSSLE